MNLSMRVGRGCRAGAVVAAALLTVLSPKGQAQQDPYEALRAYDYQSRGAVASIRREIAAAGRNKARLATIEMSLLAVLRDPSSTRAARQEVCRFLYAIGSARSVPALRGLLTDVTLSDEARYALERNADPTAGAALRSALAAVRGRERVGIVNSIGNRRDPLAVGALRSLARAQDDALAGAAAAALGKIGTLEAMAALRTLRRASPAVANAMLRCADRLAVLGKSTNAERTYVALAAKGNGPAVRVAAMRSLAAGRSAQAAPVALTALTDPDSRVRVAAASVVASLRSVQTVRRAISGWQKMPPDARVALLSGWGVRREPAALSVAVRSTHAADPAVRKAAIHAAARIGRDTVVELLAEEQLPLGGEATQAAREALASMPGKAAADEILRLSAAARPEVRKPLMWVLADRPGPSSTSALLAAANGSAPSVAVEALKAIGSVGRADEVEPLARLLSTTADDSVRETAAQAVVSCVQRSGNADRAVEPVLAALPQAGVAARCAMLAALAGIGGQKSLAALTDAASSRDADTRRAAVQGLADSWSDTSALPVLFAVARKDELRTLRVLAVRGGIRLIAQDGSMSATDKVKALSEALIMAERADEKRQAIGALRTCRIPQAVDVVSGCLSDAELFVDAAEAVLYLAAAQKQGDRELPAVRTSATAAALDRIIARARDADLKERATKLK